MHGIGEILIPISFFVLTAFVIYFVAKFSYETKKALIEKGGNIEFPKKQFRFPLIEVGMTCVGMGIGLLASLLPMSMNIPTEFQEMTTAASVFTFSGLGMISAYFLRRKLEEKQ